MKLGISGPQRPSVGISLLKKIGRDPSIDDLTTVFFDYVTLREHDPGEFFGIQINPEVTATWTYDGTPFEPDQAEPLVIPEGARIVGSYPSTSSGVTDLDFGWNVIAVSGVLLPIPQGTQRFALYDGNNAITGNIPSIPLSMEDFTLENTGSIDISPGLLPDISQCVDMYNCIFTNVGITGLTTESFPLELTTLQLTECALSEDTIEVILAAFAIDIEFRDAEVYIDLTGTNTANPSVAALATRDALLLAQPGWTIALNGD